MAFSYREIPYCFYRYILRENEKPLPFAEQLEILQELEGLEIAYRKANPSELDKDTSIANLGHFVETFQNREERVIHFFIAKRITERKVYKREEVGGRKIIREAVRSAEDECAVCQVVALPSRGLMALEDRSGESHLPARSGINRLSAIIRQIRDLRLDFEDFSKIEDLRRYIRSFDVHTVSFKARYANPSIDAPGDELHEWLLTNNAYIVGNAKAFQDEEGRKIIRNPDEGFIGEILGLAQRGYAEIGIDGTTSQGYRIKTEKKPRGEDQRYYPVRIYVPYNSIDETWEDHLRNVAKVLIEFSLERP